ncbi:MAG: choice-of-anchor D domain-containing protein [Deltaproteobacteria bacterium]
MRTLTRFRLTPVLAALVFSAACDCGDSALYQLDATIVATPTPLAFGTVLDVPSTQVLTVENVGRAELEIYSIERSEDWDARFSFAAEPVRIEADGRVEWAVTFDPTFEGPAGGAIHIHSNDIEMPVLVVPLEALAERTTPPAPPQLVVCAERAGAAATCSAPHTIDFGTVPSGESREGAIVLENRGGSPLSIASASVVAASSAVQVLPSLADLRLAPGATAVLEVDFVPTDAQPQNATVRITSNDPIAPTIDVTIRGQGATAGCGGIQGRICDVSGNGPAAGARVYTDASGQRFEATTDMQGDWSMTCVPEGTWTFRAENGSWSTSFTADVIAGEQTQLTTEQCLEPTSAQVAVVWGEWDEMERILDRMGVTYTMYRDVDDLVDQPSVLNGYDIVFFNCGFDEWRALQPGPMANLRAFVEQGGSIYASDLGYDIVEVGWPAYVTFDGNDSIRDDAEWAPPYDGYANVVNPSLAAALGGATQVYIESPGAAMISVSSQTTTYLDGDRFMDGGNHPMMVGFRPTPTSGRVFYTDFHQEGAQQVERVFEWLIANL